ncbi:Fur family transcriptional regulator [Candidatus Entotheonella palauensis]|uniref:Fur family transcriptional regulator n=1 Tax=Candidatus Entotheonella palauensis TaxID=93172 RepID=UPI000B802E0C
MPVFEQAERLRAAGLKATGPRIAILDAVERNSHHPSAEDIYQELVESHPSLSLSTVYGTLNAFARAGLVRKLSEVDGRLRVDGTKTPHDHAICRICGAIFDVEPDPSTTPILPSELPGGLAVLDVRIEYDVVCAQCKPTSV